MAMFKGFKPQGLQKIAGRLGYTGSMDNFDNYLEQNPEKKRQMIVFEDAAKKMARGGIIKMQEGGNTPPMKMTEPQIDYARKDDVKDDAFKIMTEPQNPTSNIEDFSTQQALAPTLPEGGATVAVDTPITDEQLVPTTSGQVEGDIEKPAITKAETTQAPSPTLDSAAKVQTSTVSEKVKDATAKMEAAQGIVSQEAQVNPAQQTESAVSKLKAAQGAATELENPIQREIQDGELISPAANAEKAAKFSEQIQAAEASPSKEATVAGQLESLTSDFSLSNPPPYAAGALRAVQAEMARRGLGASSMAGQALIQGALEAALPIAQADASTFAKFEAQNLSNRQQRAMLAAEQRAAFIGQEFDQEFQSRVQNAAKISDVANMNFTAEQSIALENSRAANTMNLANLSNEQAMVMAEASALANLDMANLDNRQQAEVRNAQSFLEMDMANLNNEQQMTMFKSQAETQGLFSDQAAENSTRQFNATSENQTNQFFQNLAAQVSQFNTEQANAMARYNAGEENALEQFMATMKNQREQFNAQNRLVIDQSNAQWRRQVATADTASVNRANEINAKALIDVSTVAYNNLWQGFRDDMEFAWKTADNALDRAKDITLRKMQDESTVAAAALAADSAEAASLAKGVVNMATSDTAVNIIDNAVDWVFDFFS